MKTKVDNTIVLKCYGRETATFKILTFADVIKWATPLPTPCDCCEATGQLHRETYTGPCGRCNGTGTATVDLTPSHVWFYTVQKDARQAKVNGRLRTWKRDANRIELPLKYGMYEYFVYTKDDIDSGRLLERIG
jgi:hypothetical protein